MKQNIFIFLCVLMSVIQFIWVALILFWLKKTRSLSRQGQTRKKGFSHARWSTIPTFTRSLLNKAWTKHIKNPKKDINIYGAQLAKPHLPVIYDTLDDNTYGSIYETKSKMQSPQNLDSIKTFERGSLVLHIYYKFLGLQAVHCFLWVILCVALAVAGESPIAWRNKGDSKFTYYVGTGLVIVLGSALLDGVQVFLAQYSVGRQAIDKAYFFGISWGLFNALVCTLLSSIGDNRSNPTINTIRIHTKYIPWWDPYFDRCIFMFLFNATILSTHYSQKPRMTTVSPTTDREPEQLGTKKTIPSRDAWINLGLFNVFGSLALILLYILDFTNRPTEMKPTDEFGVFTLLLICGFVFFFLGYTPILYYTLIKDSRYWSESWNGALTSICPAEPQSTNLQNMVVDYNAIQYQQVLGRGGFSTVYRGHLWTTFSCAIKVLHVPEMTKEIVERFLQEVRIFSKLRHPNLVSFVAACISPPELCIVMELCTPMSLADLIKQHNHKEYNNKEEERKMKFQKKKLGLSKLTKIERNRQKRYMYMANDKKLPTIEDSPVLSIISDHSKEFGDVDSPLPRCNSAPNFVPDSFDQKKYQPKSKMQKHVSFTLGQDRECIMTMQDSWDISDKRFSLRQALDIALGIASGLKYMHSICGVLHRDLKGSNILFDVHGCPKICDFGLSREFQELNEENSFAGTIGYMSPEVLRKEKATNKSDVYSFGIIFWEILTSRLAWTKYFHRDWRHLNKRIPFPRTYAFQYIFQSVSARKQRPEIYECDHIHQVLKVMIRECWADDAVLRPTFSDLIDRIQTFRRSHHFHELIRAEETKNFV